MKSQADKHRSEREFKEVFHVSQLKACHFDVTQMGQFPQCDTEGLLAATPLKLLERKIVKQGNRAWH
ncbi:hypothetical protein Tco_0675538 [Tanacetum coccineum]